MPSLPTGTVTFLFTDIEGSTTLLQRLGDRRYAEVLAEHQRLLRDAFSKGNGQEIDTQGDAFLVAFSRARDAVAAAVAAQQALMKHPWPDGASLQIRMGLHTGEPISTTDRYVGLDVHRAARIGAAGHGSQILLSDAVSGLAARDLPPGVTLRDLGTHRLKDLREPEHLFQIVHPALPAKFPPLKTLDVLPNNLPRQLTSFIGREREMAEVKRLLSTAYLVTLTGPGGAGKTRLALQVAADLLDHYPDGVWFVELAPLADPALVATAVASALDVPEQPDRRIHETLASYLRAKRLLFLLDNCEHVVSACRDLADDLLHACPNLRMLATSQEALGVEGELAYHVPSLGLPDPRHLPPLAQLTEYEAIRLFVERAAFSQPEFVLTDGNASTVAQICHRLDGIPLAIELAAVRTKVLSVDQIAARLDDRFRLLAAGTRKALPRHQTLRATMDWSHDLLAPRERTLFRRLSVFAGGWTLDAAEAVCSGSRVDPGEILDLLTLLVDRSLVLADTKGGEARYRLLETVRQYGRDKLAEAGETDEGRRRHGDWYLALAEEAGPKLRGREQKAWLERLETEHDNLRAALEYTWTEPGGTEAAFRLVGGVWWFWYIRGYWSEGGQWLERVLSRSTSAPASARAEALGAALGLALLHRSDHDQAALIAQAIEANSEELGDKRSMAKASFFSGVVAMAKGEHERAAVLLEDGLQLFRELGDTFWMGTSLQNLGNLARDRGDYAAARSIYETILPLRRELGDWGLGLSLKNLGDVVLYQDDHERAEALFRESLACFREIGFKQGIGWTLASMARLAAAKQQLGRAARLWGAEDALRELVGYHYSPARQTDRDRLMASVRAGLGDATFSAAWAEGRAMTLEQAIEYALNVPDSGAAQRGPGSVA